MPENLPPSPDSRQIAPKAGEAAPQPYPDPIPGIIPFGSFCLFVGPPKTGKTSLYASWVPRLLEGRSICGQSTNAPNAVGVITTDHKWALNQGAWFEKVGIQPTFYSLRDDPRLNWADMRTSPATRITLLKYALDKLKLPPGAFLVIDVATVFITNKLNDYNEVVAGIGSMTQVLDAHELTCLAVGHMSKQRTDPKDRYLRPHERVSGSGALVGYSDTTMYLLGPEDTGNPHHTFGWLPTHAKAGTFDLVQNPETGLFEMYHPESLSILADDPLYGVIQVVPKQPESMAYAVLLELIQRVCQVEISRAKTKLHDLLLDGRVVRTGRGQYSRPTPS